MASEGEMVTVTVWVGRLLAVAVMYLVSVRVATGTLLLVQGAVMVSVAVKLT